MNISDSYISLNDLYCVIVLYKTDLHNSVSFNSLIKAVEKTDGALDVLLYNNSPEVNIDTIGYRADKLNISEVKDVVNSGVSKAYNTANTVARTKKKQWLLLLDQDTELPADFFSAFFSEWKKDAANNCKLYMPVIKAGDKIVSPANYFLYRGFLKKEINPGSVDIKNLAIINSGVIINTHTFEDAGGFNEEVQLDFSDISFFRRLKKVITKGIILNITCKHSFSSFEYDDYEKNFSRFKVYNDNAIAFARERGVSKMLLFLQVFIRAVHLSIKFKSLNFLRNIKYI